MEGMTQAQAILEVVERENDLQGQITQVLDVTELTSYVADHISNDEPYGVLVYSRRDRLIKILQVGVCGLELGSALVESANGLVEHHQECHQHDTAGHCTKIPLVGDAPDN